MSLLEDSTTAIVDDDSNTREFLCVSLTFESVHNVDRFENGPEFLEHYETRPVLISRCLDLEEGQ